METLKELDQWMTDNCYNDGYAIAGRIIHEGFGIDQEGSNYIWYFTERGSKRIIKQFESEREIVTYAFEQIEGDKIARRHCIGFLQDNSKAEKLVDELNRRGIEFLKDAIPYGGLEDKRIRIFVFGCDINLVRDLEEIYTEDLRRN